MSQKYVKKEPAGTSLTCGTSLSLPGQTGISPEISPIALNLYYIPKSALPDEIAILRYS
jgi:hypothetical protein